MNHMGICVNRRICCNLRTGTVKADPGKSDSSMDIHISRKQFRSFPCCSFIENREFRIIASQAFGIFNCFNTYFPQSVTAVKDSVQTKDRPMRQKYIGAKFITKFLCPLFQAVVAKSSHGKRHDTAARQNIFEMLGKNLCFSTFNHQIEPLEDIRRYLIHHFNAADFCFFYKRIIYKFYLTVLFLPYMFNHRSADFPAA